MKTIDLTKFIRITLTDSNAIIDAGKTNYPKLLRIVELAKKRNKQVILRNCKNLKKIDLQRLVNIGKENLVVDLT